MKIHLEGMGVLGSILAWNLLDAGYDITWNDVRTPVAAWPACTGSILPTGNAGDLKDYEVWQSWFHNGPWPTILGQYIEESSIWYTTKHPPLQGKYPAALDLGLIRLGSKRGIHFNAQQFVTHTRRLLANREGDPQNPALTIVAHGFNARRGEYKWGWAALVELEVAPELRTDRRPALCFPKHYHRLAYAYPAPGTPYWYAGSIFVIQQVPQRCDIAPKLVRWAEALYSRTNGMVEVKRAECLMEGWRPVASPRDSGEWVKRLPDGRLAVIPLWHNGVRRSPSVVRAVEQALAEAVA